MRGGEPTRPGGPGGLAQAVTRLLSAGGEVRGRIPARTRLLDEAREFFGVSRSLLLAVDDESSGARLVATSGGGREPGPGRTAAIAGLRELGGGEVPALALSGEPAAQVDSAFGATAPAATLLLLPLRGGGERDELLMIPYAEARDFGEEEIEAAVAFATAAVASLVRARVVDEHGAQIARQAALSRAARSLNESLDLNRVLVRICQEAASILGGDNAAVFRGTVDEGMTVEAVHGLAPEAIGQRFAPGRGLVGMVAARGRAVVADDDHLTDERAEAGLFGGARSRLAVPLRWDGALRGVLAVGFTRRQILGPDQEGLLEAFGELAAAACRNASMHSALARAARTDGLTGCLNHAAMHDVLRREVARSARSGQRLALVLLDMDDFKQVNEEHGHLVGDEVLRRVGHALRRAVRQYDSVARYGGDEFAIVMTEADEHEAAEIADRALAGVSAAVGDLNGIQGVLGASAGVAEWTPGENSTGLIQRADRALLYGKHEGLAGSVVTASEVPGGFRSGRFRRREIHPTPLATEPWPDTAREQTERLRARMRELALANELGARLAAMTNPGAILEAAVDALDRAYGYFLCAVVHITAEDRVESAASRGPASMLAGGLRWSQPRGDGLIGRCLRERRAVIVGDVREEPDYTSAPETRDVRAELVVPLWVGGALWGAIDVEEIRPHAFDADDARLVQTVADMVGSALHSALQYERLEGAYVDTAEALAAALETKESYGASHSRAVIERAQAVGTRLGLGPQELRTLRLAAIFHDIGKIAVPERILNKPGPLTKDERREIERHPVMGDRILSPVEFLSDVRPLVRHEHERWDGRGYPDGLAQEEIPIGSRIILACEAYDAMTSDRPYRAALTEEEARAELLAEAGKQFDERVVTALLD